MPSREGLSINQNDRATYRGLFKTRSAENISAFAVSKDKNLLQGQKSPRRHTHSCGWLATPVNKTGGSGALLVSKNEKERHPIWTRFVCNPSLPENKTPMQNCCVRSRTCFAF